MTQQLKHSRLAKEKKAKKTEVHVPKAFAEHAAVTVPDKEPIVRTEHLNAKSKQRGMRLSLDDF